MLCTLKGSVDRDTWAKTMSPNKNIRLYIGVGGSADSVNGFVGLDELQTIFASTQMKYSSFGGAMVWDVSSAYGTPHVAFFPMLERSHVLQPTTASTPASKLCFQCRLPLQRQRSHLECSRLLRQKHHLHPTASTLMVIQKYVSMLKMP